MTKTFTDEANVFIIQFSIYMEALMQEFIILIGVLLVIAFMQKIAGVVLDKNELGEYKTVVDIACIVTCYLLLGRYVYVHLIEDLIAFLGFTF